MAAPPAVLTNPALARAARLDNRSVEREEEEEEEVTENIDRV